MTLSVVIGTHNRRARLQACVESIFAETETPVRVYVVDAGSSDGTVEYLHSLASERLVPVFGQARTGQAGAYNPVFATIGTPYVCWLSDDNVIVNRGLDLAVRILEQHPRIGMVGLKVRDMTGPFAGAPYVGGISPIGILNVNQGVLRTPILKAVGGFSEAFRDYGIDPDLTAKVILSGHAVAYTRPIAVHHFRGWSADPSSDAYARQMEKQRVYLDLYVQKYGPFMREDLGWRLRRAGWRVLRRTFGSAMSLDSPRSVLGLIGRDWYNLLNSRFVSVLDPLLCLGKPFHFLQQCPISWRPSVLPPDPVTAKSALLDEPSIAAPRDELPIAASRDEAPITASRDEPSVSRAH